MATGLSVSHSTSSGFLTKAESESAMATTRQHNLIGTHIDAVRSNTFGGRGRGNGKNSRRGAKRGAGRSGNQLRQLQPNEPSASSSPLCRPLRHRSSRSSSVNNNNNNNNSRPVGRLHPRRPLVVSRVPLLPVVVVVVGGRASNASCAYLGWRCPHPTRHRLQAGATYTSRFGRKNSSFPPSILRLCRHCPSNPFLP